MAYTNNMVRPPVSFSDANDALGTSYTDLDKLCSSSSINKWAWYKPIRYATKEVITDTIRISAKFGLSPVRNTNAELIFKQSSSMTLANFNSAAATTNEWTYNKPSGGESQPYRLSDFACEDLTLNRGYKETDPPIKLLGSWVVERNTLKSVANTYFVDSVLDSSDIYNWGLKIYTSTSKSQQITSGAMFTSYAARFGIPTAYNINTNGDPMIIPITYILNQSITGEDWRMGLMVYVPSFGSNSEYIGIFTSKGTLKTLSTAMNTVQTISPEMCTNQLLASRMNDYMTSQNLTTYNFRAIPILVKDAYLTFTNSRTPEEASAGHGPSLINVYDGARAQIYTLPSGNVESKISIIASSGGGSDEDKTTSNGFTLGTKFNAWVNTDPNGASWGNHRVNFLTITRQTNVTREYTASIDVDYTQLEGSVVKTYTFNGTVTIPINSQYTANNTTYYGKTISGGVELAIKTIRRFVVS